LLKFILFLSAVYSIISATHIRPNISAGTLPLYSCMTHVSKIHVARNLSAQPPLPGSALVSRGTANADTWRGHDTLLIRLYCAGWDNVAGREGVRLLPPLLLFYPPLTCLAIAIHVCSSLRRPRTDQKNIDCVTEKLYISKLLRMPSCCVAGWQLSGRAVRCPSLELRFVCFELIQCGEMSDITN
jgi:hypothetical protein